MAARLAEISRCMDELASARRLRPAYPGEGWGLLLWEMDWLEELHRLLHAEGVA